MLSTTSEGCSQFTSPDVLVTVAVPVAKSARPADRRCQLCHTGTVYNFHHLIPRKNHTNRWFRSRYDRGTLNLGLHICRQCHDMIHTACPDEKLLGRSFSTPETLAAHPVMAAYLCWKQRRLPKKIVG